jgi:Zn-dependent protease with chaperone function
MTELKNLYPATPSNVPETITAASTNFKKEVKKVLFSIALFFIVYIILFISSIILAIGCVYLGFMVLIKSGHFLGIIAGLGIMSVGIMVFVFLIKFIFSVKKFDESGSIEITEMEHPTLFKFIKQLTIDTQTQFPKKIILTPEVNACVFYNDSFWSMLFPVKKNLKIGLGLVNSLTLSEFKAVMAHEFGHFSQRSMKLGSFVYNVNKAIFNMLYDNKSFGEFLQGWGNLHAAIGLFVAITSGIIKGIQKILQKMYGLINKSYMSLSREMEFHADAVAASVSGSENCISALRKVELSDVCYQEVLQKANNLVKENTHFKNFYTNHDVVLAQYATSNNLPLENNMPMADDSFFKKFQHHKVNIKDQWASHPPREERNKNLESLNVKAIKDTKPAWLLFNEPEVLQEKLTSILYSSIVQNEPPKLMNDMGFKEMYLKEVDTYKLPDAYNHFYDDRQMNDMDFDSIISKPYITNINRESFNELFSDKWLGITKKLSGNEYDNIMLKAILDKQIDVKSFDYDGKKMDKASADTLLKKVTTEIEEQKVDIQKHEEDIFLFFYNVAKQKDDHTAGILLAKYKNHFSNRKLGESFFIVGQRIIDILSPLSTGQTVGLSDASQMAKRLKEEEEDLKPILKEFEANGVFSNNEALLMKLNTFHNGKYAYFDGNSFLDGDLNTIHQTINDVLPEVGVAQFKTFKDILVYQLEVYETVSSSKL